MRVNEVKETREVVVKTEYVATDGRFLIAEKSARSMKKLVNV